MIIRILLISLLLACSLNVQANNASTQATKTTDKTEASKEHEKAIKHVPESAHVNVASATVSTESKECLASKSCTHEAEEKSLIGPEWGIVWVTLLLFAVTFALAIFTYKLWTATLSLAKDAKNTAERQASEMEKSLEIANKSADAAILQAKTAQNALERSNRAWVGVFGPVAIIKPLTFKNGRIQGTLRLTLKNIGVSPAVGTICFPKFIVAPFPHLDPRGYASNVSSPQGIDGFGITIFPGDPIPFTTLEIDQNIKNEFHPTGTGNVSLWFNGQIGYKDEFGTPHTSSFLFSFENTTGTRSIDPQVTTAKGQFLPFGFGWINT